MRMSHYFCSASAVVLFLASAAPMYAEDVRFSDYFSTGNLGNDVVVQTELDQTLLLNEGSYILKEKNLFLTAPKARVSGKVVIEAFGEADAAPPKADVASGDPGFGSDGHGLKGKPGDPGNAGTDAGTWSVDVGELTFEPGATLSLIGRGQKGGTGQKGGMGGKGKTGKTGGNASDDIMCPKPCPEAGERGFPGGRRGAGGVGGTGGIGSTIYLTQHLQQLASTPASGFTIKVPGGQPGDTGAFGERGEGGDGGARGAGSSSCTCNTVPGPAPRGEPGPNEPDPTPKGTEGAAGVIQQL